MPMILKNRLIILEMSQSNKYNIRKEITYVEPGKGTAHCKYFSVKEVVISSSLLELNSIVLSTFIKVCTNKIIKKKQR